MLFKDDVKWTVCSLLLGVMDFFPAGTFLGGLEFELIVLLKVSDQSCASSKALRLFLERKAVWFSSEFRRSNDPASV